ncbi:aminoglycoside phosphotransferase [Georgenia yuyongxinii]|uniref:Aminoglycoside phosphotransferase n=1 Tax=Georgenia yuyongxinii TaxID=2589797 RepID=A0A5B8C0M7_9MICO|nr:phosphotransferase [Georgenia yuyongxinii]QDC24084.1 aminoglycoside phosphotransferase [Georgenia yuyongxinii]
MVRSALALAALATSAVPGLDVVATRPPQRATTDFQTTGLLDGGGRHWVVRVPLHPAAGAALEGEVALLANLAHVVDDGGLPFDVPRPAGFAALPEGGRAMVYRELVGRPVDLGRLTSGPGLSAELGRAIAAFHELDPAVVADSGLPVYDAEAYRKRCLAEVDEAARTGHVPSVLLNRWEHTLEDVALWRFSATPVHGDLAPDHVLVHDGQVSAMLSLADVHVGDPAEDLAWLTAAAPEDSVDAIVEAYSLARTEGTDAHLLDRALLVSELALARWLLHGVRSGEQAVVDDAAAMLRTLAADVEDAPPIGAREPVVVQDYAVAWPDADPATQTWEPGEDDAPADQVEHSDASEATDAPAGRIYATGLDSDLTDTAVTEPLHLGNLPDFLQPTEDDRSDSAGRVRSTERDDERDDNGGARAADGAADGDAAPDGAEVTTEADEPSAR